MSTLSLRSQGVGNQPGSFDGFTDIGNPGIPGSVEYYSASQLYRLTASGENIWFGADHFSFLWKKMTGDFILEGRMKFIGKGTDPHRKAGWMIRGSLSADAPHVSCTIHGDGLASLQFRRSAGEDMEELRFAVSAPDMIRMERSGSDFIMSVATFGEVYSTKEIAGIDLGGEPFAGLFLCAHNDSVKEMAEFSNVRLFQPAPDDLVQYEQYIGSMLEVMDIETGRRTVLGSSSGSWQAPNWTPEGSYLIYNADGLLYRFDISRGKSRVINTGFARKNNNDHVISFDGKMMGISHHSEEDNGRSVIYTLPLSGGRPARITTESPSYLHGWSPDGKYLIYTGERGGEFDIYRIPAEGGEEEQLTFSHGLDDGSEYAPDGRSIYFNSSRTGTMQIWRMDPDGGNPVQLTSDGLNNWFPHISPDNRWMVFLSFPEEVPADTHPFYERVYLRLLPVDAVPGTKPRVIAYLYGGQGTINVPSWSPDSKRIAFISNGIFE